MILITVIYLLLVLFSIRIKCSPFNNGLYLEGYKFENTNAVKGLLAFGILLSHLPKVTYHEMPFTAVSTIGTIGVGAFFFFSGYALAYGAKKRTDFFDGFISKKLLRIGIPFVFLFFISLIYNIIKSKTIDFLLTFAKGYPYSNTWYVFAILLFYVFFYITFKKCDFNNKTSIVVRIGVVFLLVLLYVVFTVLILQWGDWWYKTPFCFVVGIIFGFYKNMIEVFVKKSYFLIFCICVLFAFCSYFLPAINSSIPIIPNNYIWFANDTLMGISFTLLLIVILYKISFENPITSFLGKYSYEIYLWHGFVILILTPFFEKHLKIFVFQEFFSLFVLVITIIIAILFNKFSRFFIKKLNFKIV